jgi:hypothetical protein
MKNSHDMKLDFIKEHRITNTNEIKGALVSGNDYHYHCHIK